jgi:nucleoside 2-deoxyribosyltransferase
MNNTINSCPLCLNESAKPKANESNDIWKVECPVCGTYRISDDATGELSRNGPYPDLSGVVRLWSETDRPVIITTQNLQDLKSSAPAPNDVPAKLRYLLRHVARKSQHPGDGVELGRETDYPVCFAANDYELTYLAGCATELHYVSDEGTTRGSICLTLTPTGWEEVQRLPTLESADAFVAMSFAKDSPLLKQAWEDAIKPALEEDAGYKAVRLDQEHYLGDIVFEIIARIKESRFVVADVTQHRNGVYFEGGYAMGMGLPVIWMCYEGDKKDMHFDTSHLNHIVWSDPAVGGQQNSAGLVEMVEGNERGLMVRNLGRADLARTELLACCG